MELYLDGVVDEPLQSGEGTDHDDPGAETLPYSGHAELADDAAHCRGLVLESRCHWFKH